ncbi:MAG TPA: hypothetical protein DDZ68_01050 [Parvularcula sp.]|nr:hypothetical protein [Parvularcula sp.]HBS32434.1 hypothetical protein [Parvularcula sp.]HBS34151.1 hypothetical protein [Parvularcula sp.]
MRTIALILAAVAAFAGSAEARTIKLSDILAQGGGAVRGARITVIEPETAETLSRGQTLDLALSHCLEARGNPCLRSDRSRAGAGDTMLAITLEEGFSLSNLSFNEGFAGKRGAAQSVTINGVAYRMSALSDLALTDRTIFINLGALSRAKLTLRSFDLEALSAPLPGAGILMLAGFGGLALARSMRKKA